MSETGILMGMTYTDSATSVRVVIALVMSAGLLLAVLAYLLAGDWFGSRADAPDAPARPREWLWGWFALLLFNLPLALMFGFGTTSAAGTFGMLAGVVVVWLIGHHLVARVREVREPLMIGGVIVGLSQVVPI